jgi:fructose-bisphosphate aldolase class II
MVMTATVRQVFAEQPGEFDPRKYLGPARTALIEMYKRKNREVLGSAGRYGSEI